MTNIERFERTKSEETLTRFLALAAKFPNSRHTELGHIFAANLRGTLNNPQATSRVLGFLRADVEFRCEKLEAELSKH